MTIGKAINKLRSDANLSQEQFATIFGVSQQSVQKWENGDSVPELGKIIKISKHFDVSLDALILGNNNRMVEGFRNTCQIKPQYANIHDWEFYSSNLMIEYEQSTDEGLDLELYKDVFNTVSRLPKGETKKKIGDVLFEVVTNATMRKEYPYTEPSDLEGIRVLRKPYKYAKKEGASLESRVHGAWMGRVCGCKLGANVEGVTVEELTSFLKETGNYPMHRYILSTDVNEELSKRYSFPFASRSFVDRVQCMPADDDTNYTVMYQEIVAKYGFDFTPFDVSRAWMDMIGKSAYCTAERVAFCNFVKGFEPPFSAMYKNPYREWIGAQIRGDYFGYINPGDPEKAAEMAWRDASVSHMKNGIYGEMLVAAMLAVAAQTNNMEDIVRGGLAQIPTTSRLYEKVTEVVDGFKNGVSKAACFENIAKAYNERNVHHWCHTISNAMIVVASLLYGGGDYGKSICMSVEAGFDTDCNGATVGSILGMANGIESIPEYWTKPINDTLHTSIFGINTVKISDRAKLTMEHINGK
ncbi:MAG: ADP-ribosylglycohydrolase family protein [Clostridia bacterium]|nr:ADP-ribosylglycohydrolase family protein [Clostridia bacterium]